MKYILFSFSFLLGLFAQAQIWITAPDQTMLLKKKELVLVKDEKKLPLIEVNDQIRFQTVDGFGFTLTGGSAQLINKIEASQKINLLQELFGSNENSIGVSYLRLSIGASDLDSFVFSYDDLPVGETDTELEKFSLSSDTINLIPILKQVLKIKPGIKIMGSPWSPPTWMKSNKKTMGGHLLPQYYNAYAAYFVKYIQQMKLHGIHIDAITLQNEPEHGGNNPSMLMSADEQAAFIKTSLGPLFEKNNIKTKIVVWDHNCDNPGYPIKVLEDSDARKYIDGSAFHLYNGNISALSKVKEAFPDKNLYFTEQWTGKKGTFDGDLSWHVKNVVIGSMNNWSRIALEWNLANDPNFGPHTPGGCTECKGAVTIDGSKVERNVAYYIIAHASKFIPAGSIRIGSTQLNGLPNISFLRPDGKSVTLVINESKSEMQFDLKSNATAIRIKLLPGEVATAVF
jgi:glucosylceramidase